MYHIIIVPPVEGSIISLFAKTAHEANWLFLYFTKLGCTVTSERN